MMKFGLIGLALGVLISCAQNQGKEEDQSIVQIDSSLHDVDSTSIVSTADGLGELERSLLSAGLIDVQAAVPEVYVALKYASTENFFGQNVYGDLEKCYVQPELVEMLKVALQTLWENYPELTFLVYDGVRPLSVQQILWDSLDKPDSLKPLYVADPQRGSLHNFGLAIDLTLADRKTGEALDLGTPYDYFGYLAYPDREEQMLREGKLQVEHVERRKVLRNAMKAAGFSEIGSEWWHFNAFSLGEARKRYQIIP